MRRVRAVLLSALLALATATIPAARAAGPAIAHSAAHTRVKDEGKLRFIKGSGSTLIDEGRATGTIPGTVKLHFTYNGNPSVSARFTIVGRHGNIEAHANARLSSPTNPNPSFSGVLTITGGTGSYAHAHGSGKLYGVFNRRNYGMIVQTEGMLLY